MPDFSLEQQFDGSVCGIDEVGRGPLAGPVVAACVYVPPPARDLPFWAHVNDSKKLPPKRRDELTVLIQEHTIWGIGQASVEEIDALNILQATFVAMTRAFLMMGQSPPSPSQGEGWGGGRITKPQEVPHPNPPPERGRELHLPSFATALIDGNRAPKNFPVPVQTVIKGDGTSLSIAAASIIAKVTRDQMMAELHTAFPVYGWVDNAGYGTAAHLAAIQTYGPCPHHRRSFAPVRNALGLAS